MSSLCYKDTHHIFELTFLISFVKSIVDGNNRRRRFSSSPFLVILGSKFQKKLFRALYFSEKLKWRHDCFYFTLKLMKWSKPKIILKNCQLLFPCHSKRIWNFTLHSKKWVSHLEFWSIFFFCLSVRAIVTLKVALFCTVK